MKKTVVRSSIYWDLTPVFSVFSGFFSCRFIYCKRIIGADEDFVLHVHVSFTPLIPAGFKLDKLLIYLRYSSIIF